jgi:hypothetical protein
LKNYTLHKTYPPFHSTTLFSTWTGKRNANRDEITTAAFDVLLRHIERVIVHAGPIYGVLDELKGQLACFQKLLLFEDSSISFAKTDVLADFWTKFGGNNRKLQDLDRQLALLNELKVYRGKVLVPVTATVKSMTAVVNQMEGMRERLRGGSGLKK